MTRLALLSLLAAVACARSAADHEELGDQKYAARSYPDALAEYRLGVKAAPGNAGLHAKMAAAAMHTGDVALAAGEYLALGKGDRSRVDEAADGLERAARQAQQTSDRTALALALEGLRTLAPGRPLGRYARVAVGDALAQGNTADAFALLPMAIAAAGDGRSADSLLYLYGVAALRLKSCDTATAAFDAVLQRQRNPDVVDAAREGLAACALVTGQAFLAAGKPGDAESWLRRATAPGAGADVARAAWLGLGDVRLAQGNVMAALEAYQQALAGGSPGDSISVQATTRINAVGRIPPAAPSPQP